MMSSANVRCGLRAQRVRAGRSFGAHKECEGHFFSAPRSSASNTILPTSHKLDRAHRGDGDRARSAFWSNLEASKFPHAEPPPTPSNDRLRWFAVIINGIVTIPQQDDVESLLVAIRRRVHNMWSYHTTLLVQFFSLIFVANRCSPQSLGGISASIFLIQPTCLLGPLL
jgi:hypothetical protein